MKIDRIDHLVLTVNNIEVTCNFYCYVLGMQVVTFGNCRKALHVTRSVAIGAIESIYLRDPDGNLIEVSNYRNSNQTY
jgi:catechol 2,3-dioxygenase-like lactoylglutathione lyase family enzyme